MSAPPLVRRLETHERGHGWPNIWWKLAKWRKTFGGNVFLYIGVSHGLLITACIDVVNPDYSIDDADNAEAIAANDKGVSGTPF